MPIINKGKLTLSEVVQRQVNQDWPSANTDYDLFVQDLIAAGNVVANGLIIRNIEVSDNILTGNVTASSITANTLTLDIITANTFVGIDTDQVTEGSNLYFTNTRAILSVFPATTQLVVSTPVFNYNIDQYSGDNPEIYVTAGETISFELLHSSSHPFNIRVSDGGSEYNNGLIHVDTDGTISTGSAAQGKYTGKLFWKIPYELAGNTYVYQCTNHSSMVGNIVIQGSVLSTITNRDVTLNNLTVNGDLVVQGNTVTLDTATLVIEDKNIVLANGAADAATADGAGITIDGAGANITYLEAGDKFEINKNVFVIGDLDVTGNLSGNGLVIRGIEVSDAVLSGNVTVEGGITGNTIAVDSITSNIWNNLYTANVIETSGNLYFTVNRARSAFTAGDNITIVEGVISALQQVTVSNDNTVIETLANTLTYNMGRVISDARNVLVIVEGLIQIPTVDYTVAGSNLIFLDQPPPGANIEVRFFGTEGSTGSAPTLISVVNSFVSSGNVDYALTISPPGKDYVSVVIDGVSQQSESYSLTGSILTFTDAPTVGANIDVRILSGQAARPFSTRTFVGDGANINFTVSPGYSADNILVFENGVAQVPGTDYTYDDGTLIFTTAPAPNVAIQVRELGTSGPNLLSTIRGLDQITGNLVPDVDGFRSLGAPDKRFKDLYLTGNTIYIGNATISVDNAGSISLASASAPALALPTQGSFIFRNKLINGNFDVWQRGTSQTTSGYGSADRWSCLNSGSTKTASRQAFTLGQTDVPNNPKYFMRHVVSSVAGVGNYVVSLQKIEGVETLAGQTATISFWAKADASKNIAVEFEQFFGSGGSPSATISGIEAQLVSLTTVWTKYTITVDIPSVSGKTLGTDSNDNLNFLFWFDAGSDWNSRSASLGQQSGTFDIAQVQIEEGSAATPFEMRPIQTELNLCYRYYLQSISLAGTGYPTGGSQTERAMASCVFPTALRTSDWSTSWTQAGGSNNQTGALLVTQRTALSAVFSEASNAAGSQFWRGYVDIDAEL